MYLCEGSDPKDDDKTIMKGGLVLKKDFVKSKTLVLEEAKDNEGAGTAKPLVEFGSNVITSYAPVHRSELTDYFAICYHTADLTGQGVDMINIKTFNRKDLENTFNDVDYSFGAKNSANKVHDVKCKHKGNEVIKVCWKEINGSIANGVGKVKRDYCDVYCRYVNINQEKKNR